MEILKGSKLVKTSTIVLREKYSELVAHAINQETEIAKLKKALDKAAEDVAKQEAIAAEIKTHLTERIREQSATM